MNNITKDLEPLKNKLRNHPLYNNIDSIEDLKIFSNAHVYAVWDLFPGFLAKIQQPQSL